MDDFCKILLTKKDLAGEQLLAQLMEQESLRLSQDQRCIAQKHSTTTFTNVKCSIAQTGAQY